jgi:hypothetical protein
MDEGAQGSPALVLSHTLKGNIHGKFTPTRKTGRIIRG